jgi:cell division protein FtsQ
MSGDKETPERRTVLIGGHDELPAGALDPLVGAPTGSVMPPPSPPLDPAASPESAGARPRTIVIGDDELPDATYTATNSRSPEDTKGPRVHPRMKARRIAVRQAAGRRRVWWAAVLVVVVVLGLAALAVFSSSLFDIQHIRVSGVANSDPAEISEITDDVMGKAILTADLHSIKVRLEQLPWVKYAQVKMQFPHTVLVQIAERTPVAAFQSADGRWRVIDLDGRVIDVLAGRPIDYVAIFGPGPDKIAGESAPEYANIAQFVTALPPVLRPLVQEFEVDKDFNVSMTLALRSGDLTQVDLCAADQLDVQQLVSLTAFVQTRLDSTKAPPARITACKPDLITTSDS